MIVRHFNLREQPFGVTPDPRYLYASSTHREALASLLYGIESGLGFVALTANPGMGKTTLLFEALHRFKETARTVFLFQTIDSPIDLVRALLIDLGVKETRGTLVELQSQLNEVLVEQAATGQRLIVVIDEAQNLDESVLEAVRMLSNFETARHKLVQIILSGQLQLADKLAQPRLLQLRQRISIFAHLESLSAAETEAYVQHRLRVAGHQSNEPVFSPEALGLIASESQGIPRNINNICFNALTLGCALQRKSIDADVIREVLADLNFQSRGDEASALNNQRALSLQAVNSATTNRNRRSKINMVALPIAVCAIISLLLWLLQKDFRVLPLGSTVAASSSTALTSTTPVSVAHTEVPKSQATVPSPASTAREPARRVGPQDEPPSSSGRVRMVSVREGESLYSICQESFGECRPEIFREIIKINTAIADPNRIVSGQKVAIPVFLPNAMDNK